jgi:hypothetical protein
VVVVVEAAAVVAVRQLAQLSGVSVVDKAGQALHAAHKELARPLTNGTLSVLTKSIEIGFQAPVRYNQHCGRLIYYRMWIRLCVKVTISKASQEVKL